MKKNFINFCFIIGFSFLVIGCCSYQPHPAPDEALKACTEGNKTPFYYSDGKITEFYCSSPFTYNEPNEEN